MSSDAMNVQAGTEVSATRMSGIAIHRIAAVAAIAALLGACGVKGGLDAPPEAKADNTAKAESAQGKAEGATGKPHQGFILDGILR
ncbi:MAG: lipoprotein [Hyphomicrobium sp.]|nr:lipoprotein [Hyphomicrobium sp.]